MKSMGDLPTFQPSIETIMTMELDKELMDVEENFYLQLIAQDYVACEEILNNFCYALLDLDDMEQVFVTRIYFTSIMTHLIHTSAQKNQLHPRMLTEGYRVIEIMEEFTTLTEYLLYIPQFVEHVKQAVTSHPFETSSKYVDESLLLIHHHLEGNTLTVQWLAAQLGISQTHLANLFKLELGESIGKYIARRKIEEVVYELCHTNKSLKDIRKNMFLKITVTLFNNLKRYKDWHL